MGHHDPDTHSSGNEMEKMKLLLDRSATFPNKPKQLTEIQDI